MSSWAQIVEPIWCTQVNGPEFALQAGSKIKCVRVIPNGYVFNAMAPHSKEWVVLQTTMDLPGHTDRGRAQREERGRATLAKGRPTTSASPVTRRVTLFVSNDQYAWLESTSGDEMVPHYVRKLLHSAGMPY